MRKGMRVYGRERGVHDRKGQTSVAANKASEEEAVGAVNHSDKRPLNDTWWGGSAGPAYLKFNLKLGRWR